MALEPTYALQVVRPFWKLLRRYPQIPSQLIDEAEATPPDQRVPVAQGQALLEGAVALTGDPNLGLLAARATELGAFEVLEYVAVSAPTWRAAIECVFRYSHLMNEAADFRLEIEGGKDRFALIEQLFLAIPFEHSEAIGDQDIAVWLMAGIAVEAAEAFPDYARWALDSFIVHRDIVRRFGRFQGNPRGREGLRASRRFVSPASGAWSQSSEAPFSWPRPDSSFSGGPGCKPFPPDDLRSRPFRPRPPAPDPSGAAVPPIC